MVPTSVPPYASTSTGPHQWIICRFTSTGHAEPVCTTWRSELTSYDERTSSGSASRREKCVGTMTEPSIRCSWIARRTSSASNRGMTTSGVPASSNRTAVNGPVW